ncbi:tetratricopeptide (TPR) repeat protein [Pedobacter sp. UYP30]|uniref:DUF6377 domain-containing protein n=1 Tax=Pedobacter sp. UYP30 TaxID=1756400 RepID=UPI003395BF61
MLLRTYKNLLFALLLMAVAFPAQGQSRVDSLLSELNTVLKNEQSYISLKRDKINVLKNQLHSSGRKSNYFAYLNLYEAYKTFNYDSAYTYAHLMQQEAIREQNPSKIAYANVKLGFTMLSSGMFKETFEILNEIDTAQLSGQEKIEYYALASRSYYDLADFDRNPALTEKYNKLGGKLITEALSKIPPTSYEYLFLSGLKSLREGDFEQSLSAYQRLINMKMDLHQYAINASTLAYIYAQKGNSQKALELLIKAAISDIKSATKETTALLSLSDILYKRGDMKNSYSYIKQAMDDANFYGARHREIQVGNILPIIEGEKIKTVEAQRRQLIIYALLITLLVVAVVYFAIIVFRQLKKLKKADEIIVDANKSLQMANQQLAEANLIKNDYIGYYFNINSRYLEKLEKFKKTIEKKLQARSYDDALRTLETLHLDKEREELLQTFDRIFLKVFPSFIIDFNQLFSLENKIVLGKNELMNTELRIFALIRMGIHDNERIAGILDYSVNTIYSYKNRVKTKSIVSNDEFERKLMGITPDQSAI